MATDPRAHVALARAGADIHRAAAQVAAAKAALAGIRVDPWIGHDVRYALNELDTRLHLVDNDLDYVVRKLAMLAKASVA
jgi:hypothetical protein